MPKLLTYMHTNRFKCLTQALTITVLTVICIIKTAQYAVAADVNLTLNSEGNVVNATTGKTVGELHHGWREDVLFVSLSSGDNLALQESYTVSLSSNTYSLDALVPTLYAVHGAFAELVSSASNIRTWDVTAPPASAVTIVAQVPSGVLQAGFGWRTLALLGKLSDTSWLLLSFFSPLLSIGFFAIRQLWLTWRAKRIPHTILDPTLLQASPAALTVVWRGFVSRRATAATVVDLAVRGHVQILVRNDALMIYRRESDDPLRSHEARLLHRWFGDNWNSKIHLLAEQNKRELVNQQSTASNIAVYDEINGYGWFSLSPLLSHWQVMAVSFLSTVFFSFCFIIIFAALPSATPLLWFLTGCLTAVGLAYTWAPRYTKYSLSGAEMYAILNSSKSILSAPQQIHPSLVASEAWQHWLPLAIVLDVPNQWLRRWSDYPFQQPEWFLTENPIRDFNHFLELLNPVLSIASESIRDKILPAYL